MRVPKSPVAGAQHPPQGLGFADAAASTIPAPFQHHLQQAGRIPAFSSAPAFLHPRGMYFLILSGSKKIYQGQGSTGRGAFPLREGFAPCAGSCCSRASTETSLARVTHRGIPDWGMWGELGFVWTCRLLTLRSTNSWNLRKPQSGTA